MIDALRAWLDAMGRTGDRAAACAAAAGAGGRDPRRILREAGRLAHAITETATSDLHLDASGAVVPVGAASAAIVVPRGAPWPRLTGSEPPLEVARRLVAGARLAADGPADTAIDLACGAGTFLLALEEAGVRDPIGVDGDPAALAVAATVTRRARLQHGGAAPGPYDLVVGRARPRPTAAFAPPGPGAVVHRLPRGAVHDDPWWAGLERMYTHGRVGAGVGAWMPSPSLRSIAGADRRRRLLSRHAVADLTTAPGPEGREIALLVGRVGGPPRPLPAFGAEPTAVGDLARCPFDPDLWDHDVTAVRQVRSRSVDLDVVCAVEAGGHRTDGSAWSGTWRTRGRPRLVIGVDRSVRPDAGDRDLMAEEVAVSPHPGQCLTLPQLATLLGSPALWGVLRLDLGPHWRRGASGWRRAPVPSLWVDGLDLPIAAVWGLTPELHERLIERGEGA